MHPAPFFRWIPTLLLTGSVAMAWGWWADGTLPARSLLAAPVSTEPQQTSTQTPAFGTKVGGIAYRIQPVADYDIHGLVVSMHHTDAWWDWIHAASKDLLNVVDVCVVWGANAAAGAYEKMAFSSGQFVCYVSSKDPDAWQPAYIRALSNNHLLSDHPHILRQLRRLRVGDQIHLRGQLVEYAHNAGFAFTRGTSTSRDDTGNGACETLFVQEVQVLRPAPAWPRGLFWLGVAAFALGAVLWLRQPHQARD